MDIRQRAGRTVLVGTVALSLLLGVTSPVFANKREENCRRHIEQAEFNLQKAIRKHGEHSRQAEAHRRKLQEIQAHCDMHR